MGGAMRADGHASILEFPDLVPGHEAGTAIVDGVGRYEQGEGQARFFQARRR
jgi:hypothetical protein